MAASKTFTGIWQSDYVDKLKENRYGKFDLQYTDSNSTSLLFYTITGEKQLCYVHKLYIHRNEEMCILKTEAPYEGQKYKQQILFRFNLKSPTYQGDYAFLCPHDRGMIAMNDDSFYQFIIKNVPVSDITIPDNPRPFANIQEESSCTLL